MGACSSPISMVDAYSAETNISFKRIKINPSYKLITFTHFLYLLTLKVRATSKPFSQV